MSCYIHHYSLLSSSIEQSYEVEYPYLLTLLSLGALTIAGRRPRFETLPECSECVPIADGLELGVGIDLTTTYRTAAIQYLDDSFLSLGKVCTDLPEKMRQKIDQYAQS